MAIIKLVIPLYVYGYITGVLSEMDDSYWLNEITSSAVIITKQKRQVMMTLPFVSGSMLMISIICSNGHIP